jgi:acetylglutamate kinase
MKRYIQKANVLIEALPYIQKFRGKTFVIKYGGSVIGKDDFSQTILEDLVFMECIGINPVLIHGGGKAINESLKKSGVQPKFINGLRVTDIETLKVVEDVLVNTVNKQIVNLLKTLGGKAQGISGKNGLLKTIKHFANTKNLETGAIEKTDIGYVGDIKEVQAAPLLKIIKTEEIPVIAPLGFDENNDTYNVNADIAAGEIASALKAEKLIFLTDVEGIMRNIDDKNSLISTIKIKEIESFIEDGVISGGMIPKVNSCLKAIRSGVKKTHIIDGRIAHSLLLEIFTDKGIGTEIVE